MADIDQRPLCRDCDCEIDCCEFCDAEDCEKAMCYACVRVILTQRAHVERR